MADFTHDVVDGSSGTAQFEGDVASSDVMWVLGGVIVAIKGAVRGGIVLEEMLDVVLDGSDRTEGGVTGEAMAKGFPTSGVLLISVHKGDVGPLLHVIPRTGTGWDALEDRTAECGVIKMERLAPATVSGRRQGIFPRAAEEVEGKGAQVKDGLGPWMVRDVGEGCNQGLEDHDVNGPDMRGSGVLICPSLEEGFEAEDIVGAFQPGIREAQSGKCLPHSM